MQKCLGGLGSSSEVHRRCADAKTRQCGNTRLVSRVRVEWRGEPVHFGSWITQTAILLLKPNDLLGSPMFEITGDDISLLNDEDLRTPSAAYVKGNCGSEAMPDHMSLGAGTKRHLMRGVDVRVSLPPTAAIDGFVRRAATGFQVKQQDMPRAEILAEMRPRGHIRATIKDLADNGGAYIIVTRRVPQLTRPSNAVVRPWQKP